jgi:hypothetical protein
MWPVLGKWIMFFIAACHIYPVNKTKNTPALSAQLGVTPPFLRDAFLGSESP